MKMYSLAVLLFEREKKLVVEQDGGEIFSQYERTEGPDKKKKKKDYSTLFIRYSFSTSKLVSSSLLVVASQSSN